MQASFDPGLRKCGVVQLENVVSESIAKEFSAIIRYQTRQSHCFQSGVLHHFELPPVDNAERESFGDRGCRGTVETPLDVFLVMVNLESSTQGDFQRSNRTWRA